MEPVDADVLTDDQKARDAKLAPNAAAVVDAYVNVWGVLPTDKKRIFFASTRDGNWQGYVADVDKPAAAPKKLTSSTERIASLQLTPDDKYLIYQSDIGANEDWRIFRMNLDGSGATSLTATPLRRDMPLMPKLRPNVLIYSASNNKQSKGFVYTVSTTGGDERILYTDEKRNWRSSAAMARW